MLQVSDVARRATRTEYGLTLAEPEGRHRLCAALACSGCHESHVSRCAPSKSRAGPSAHSGTGPPCAGGARPPTKPSPRPRSMAAAIEELQKTLEDVYKQRREIDRRLRDIDFEERGFSGVRRWAGDCARAHAGPSITPRRRAGPPMAGRGDGPRDRPRDFPRGPDVRRGR